MKTSELSGTRLDYWVAKAEGLNPEILRIQGDDLRWRPTAISLIGPREYCYSSDWYFGGPIIERERIAVFALDHVEWAAFCFSQVGNGGFGYGDIVGDCVRATGPTALIAAMRAYVQDMFGEHVELNV